MSDDNEGDQTPKPRLRLRRCKSTSRAEDIVTEDEKQRRAQPDKPIHKPRDSLFSWSSGFQNFEGVINWGFLLLGMGGFRLFLENLHKYGIRVNPKTWIVTLFGNVTHKEGEYPTFYLLMYTNVVLLFALFVEKLLARGHLSWSRGICLHLLNLTSLLVIPIVVINTKFPHIGPANGTIAASVYAVLFLKIWSYVQVNFWCRSSLRASTGTKLARHSSFADINIAESGGRTRTFSNSMLGRSRRLSSSDHLVQYPDNLTVKDIYYFWLAPTLCYELNFPRQDRTRKLFLIRRVMEVVVGVNVILALTQQWIIPSVVHSLLPFSNMDIIHAAERLLKLAVPNHLLWLTAFYLLFHSFLNTLGELLRFADREFYRDWWNAHNIQTFWKTWNLPVHRWALRHLFKPIVQAGYSTTQASVVVFLVSAFFHEYLISVPLRVFKAYAFLGMALQIPLLFVSVWVEKSFGSRFGNVIVWLSLIIGQPLAVMMYYHDYVVEHYGVELLQTYGKL